VPFGNDVVTIDGGLSAAATSMWSDFEADRFAASVTFAVKSKAPAVVGVPEIAPAPDSVNPGGTVPPATDQL